MEASGTGNMKLALNGALTIGTLDGANVEMLDRVGPDNIFIFGLEAHEVEARRRDGIDFSSLIEQSEVFSEVVSAVEHGNFSPDEPDRYRGLMDIVRHHDYFLVAADFEAYYARQRDAAARCGSRPCGGARRSSTPLAWGGSPPTARYANMRRSCGTYPLGRRREPPARHRDRERGLRRVTDWRVPEPDLKAILGARHGDPFAILGVHDTDARKSRCVPSCRMPKLWR